MANEPIYENLPGNQASADRTAGQVAGLESLSPTVRNAFIQYNQNRVNRGASPIGPTLAPQLLLAAETGQAQTPEPQRPVSFGGAISGFIDNLKTIGQSIPKFPQMAVNEIRSLPQLPTALEEASRESSNPLEFVGNAATAPGLRMVPGAYVAENLFGPGTPGELVRNPLFTALDVAPFAGKALKATKVNKANAADLTRAYDAQVAAFNAGESSISPRRPRQRPLRTQLTRRLDDQGQVVPNRFGEGVVDPLIEAAGRTGLGQDVRALFGGQAKDTSQIAALRSRRIQNLVDNNKSIMPETQAEKLAAQTADILERYKIDEARDAELFEIATIGDPEVLAKLPDNELGIISELRDVQQQYAELGADAEMGRGLREVNLAGSTEVLSERQATPILRARSRRERVGLVNRARNLIDDATTSTPQLVEGVVADLDAIGRASGLTKRATRESLESQLRVLASRGFDVDNEFALVRNGAFRGMSDEALDRARLFEPGGADVVAAQFKPLARSRPAVDRFRRAVAAKDGRAALHELRQLEGRAVYSSVLDGVDLDAVKAELRAMRDNGEFLRKTEGAYGDRALARLERSIAKLERRTVPARFMPNIEAQQRTAALELTRELFSDTPDFDAFFQKAENGMYQHLEGTREWAKVRREIKENWTTLKKQGFDPVFMHEVFPSQLGQVANPQVVPGRISGVKQFKERTLNYEPTVKSTAVSIRAQAIDYLVHEGEAAVFDELARSFGKTKNELIDQYSLAAITRANQGGGDAAAIVDSMISADYVPFTKEMFPNRSAVAAGGSEIWVPKQVAATIDKLRQPPLARLQGPLDMIAKPFRTSVLALSPRWHVNNIVGNAMMTGIRNPRALTYLNKAHKILKDADELAKIPQGQIGIGSGAGSIPTELVPADLARRYSKATKATKVGGVFQFLGGKQMRTWLDQASVVTDPAGRLIKKSYDYNAFVDDMYRVANYLDGNDAAVRKGLSVDEARSLGIQRARSTMQQWDRMTPFERSLIRTVFPFYGWIGHIMQYVVTYPFDHPVRTSILSNFARNELEDFGTGLPQRFFEMFMLGDTDEDGNVHALTLGGANPFGDIQNYFTLQGFVGQTHPLINTTFEALGVDTRTGTTQLYPNMYYDPELGRMAVKPTGPGGFAGMLLSNTIPQAELLANLAGISQSWKEVYRTNPNAALRMMTSQAGLPALHSNVNVPQEIFTAERARIEAQAAALSEALRTGDDSYARLFPGTEPETGLSVNMYLDQIRALQGTGALADLSPQTEETGILDLLRKVPTQGF